MPFDESSAVLDEAPQFDAASAKPEFDEASAVEDSRGAMAASAVSSPAGGGSNPPPATTKTLGDVLSEQGDIIADAARRVGSGIAEAATTAAAGLSRISEVTPPTMLGRVIAKQLTGEDPLQKGREFLGEAQRAAKPSFGVDPTKDKELVSKVIAGATSLVPIIASGPAAPLTAAGLMGESARQDAEAHGATEGQKAAAFAGGATIGVISEALLGIPALLRSAKAAGATDAVLKSISRQAVEQGLKNTVRESSQEAIEQVSQNLLANTVVGYDPTRETSSGVLEAAGLGAAIGGPVGALVQTAATLDARADASFEQLKQEAESVAAPEAPQTAVPETPVETSAAPEIAAAERAPAQPPAPPVGQSNLTAAVEKNIADARMMSPDDPAAFLRKMADSSRKQGKEEAAANFEAAEAELKSEGPGAAAATEFQPQQTTGLKRAVVDTERLARGAEEIPTVERQREEAVVRAAEDAVDADPTVAPALIERINSGTQGRAITEQEAAMLLVERQRLHNEKRQAEETAADAEIPEEQRATARAQWQEAEARLNELDHAQRTAGSTWGRLGHMYQRLIQEDFTLSAMERRTRAAKGGEPLTETESTKIKEQAAEIARLEKLVEEAQKTEGGKQEAEATASTFGSLERDVRKGGKKKDKSVSDLSARAKADSAAGDPLDHSLVYEIARAHVRAGVRGEDAVMKATHGTLAPFFEGLTERDIRRAFSEYGKVKFPSKEEVATHLRELRTLVRLQESIDRETAGLSALHSGMQRDKATQAIREKQKRLNELLKKRQGPPSPEQLASRDEARKTALRNQIEDIDKQLQTGEKAPKGEPAPPSAAAEQLMAERDAMREKLREIEEGERVQKTPEERYNETRMKVVRKQLAEAEKRIAEGDFEKRVKKPTPTKDSKLIALEAALAKEKNIIRREEHKLWESRLPKLTKLRRGARAALDASKNLVTAYDFSAPRQGFIAMLTHPVAGARAFGRMFRGAFSESQARQMEQARQHRANAKDGTYKQAGLEFTSLDETTFTLKEENLRSALDDWAQQPFRTGSTAKTIATAAPRVIAKGVRISNRAFITFLNELRADVMDSLIDANFRGRAKPTPNELAVLGNMVNVTTGRGRINPKLASSLAIPLWSPRLLASRFQYVLGQPLWHGLAHGKVEGSGRARLIVAKEYAKFMVGAYALYNVAKLFGDVEDDPRSSDFGKIRLGEDGRTRLDPWGGLQQVSVLLTRETTGETKTLKKGEVKAIRFPEGTQKPFKARDVFEMEADFLRTKFSPWLGTFTDWRVGENVVGEKVTLGSMAQNMVVPLSYRDVFEVLRNNGVPKGIALQMLSQFGAGLSVYEEQSKERPR